jgi:hypothetical protein
MRHVVSLILLTTVLLTACTPPVAPVMPSPQPKAPLAPPPATDSPALDEEASEDAAGRADEADKADGAVIIYERSGGVAGETDRWAVYPDGRIVSSDSQDQQVTEQEVSELLDEIEALGFFEMQGSYGPLDACCDRFIYRITVLRGDEMKTVHAVEGESGTPQEFWRIAELIKTLAVE